MWNVNAAKFLILLSIYLFALPVFAMNGRTTYQAKISKPDGYPLESASVNFRFTVLDTVGSCILYVEDYAAINMQDTGGLVSFALGNGSRAFPTSGTSQTFQNIFDNSVASFPCQNLGIYNPGPNDTRRVVMQFNEGVGWQTLPAMTINSVPYSMFANTANIAKTLNGKADTDFVEYTALTGLNCQSNEAIKFNGVSFSCIPVSGISVSGSVLAIGGTASAPVISMSAVSMSSDGYLTSSDYAEFKAQVSNVSATAPLASTGGSTPTISITQATSASNGYLSAADFVTFNSKQNALGYIPLDSAVSGTFAVKANNLSDLTNVATARTNLGLGTFAVANSIDLGSASATGIINEARFANRSGVTSGTQYTKVTVDGKGFVTNGSQISSGDVTTALGYTPASASASTQWNTSGTTINYTNGFVGLGTAAPQAALDIFSGSLRFSNLLSGQGISGYSGGGVNVMNLIREDAISTGGLTMTAYGGIGFATGETAPTTNYDFFINNTGRVGIGTNTPTAQLEVKNTSATIKITSSDGVSPSYLRTNLNGVFNSFFGTEGLAGTLFTNSLTFATVLGSQSNVPVQIATNGSVKTSILANGNMGVGTISPSEKLVVGDDLGDLTAGNGIVVGDATGGGSVFVGKDASNWGRISFQNDKFAIQHNDAGTTSSIYMDAGNVGIGTTAPAAKLDVQGQVKTSMGTPLVNPASEAVDFASGNTQYVTFSTCPGNVLTVNLFSIHEGSSYSIVIVAPNGCLVDFTGISHAIGGSGGTAVTAFKYPAGQKFSSTGNPMVYSFLRANNFVFVAQVVDFQ